MAWEDPIVEEVRKFRDTYAKQFNYDLDAIYRDLKSKEQQSGRTVVPCPLKQSVDFAHEERKAHEEETQR